MINFRDNVLFKKIDTAIALLESAKKQAISLPVQEAADCLEALNALKNLIKKIGEEDKERGIQHRKLKKRWRAKQSETASLRRKIRNFKYLLRTRKYTIIKLKHQLSNHKKNYRGPISADLVRLEAFPPIPSGMKDGLLAIFLQKLPFIQRQLWTDTMRLGVIQQYEPRPIELDEIPVQEFSGLTNVPKISVVTPSYNQAKYLEETMRSVLNENYPNLEYIVIDGGSTDGSVDILKSYQDRLTYWQSEPDDGQATAVREGFKRSTGEIMAWLNSDDLFLPGVLAYVADYFQRHPEVDVVYGHRIFINERSYEVARWVLPQHDKELLLWADFIPQETMFWRRSIYDKVGGIDPSFQFALDWDILLRFQRAGAKFKRLPYFLGAFRNHEEQKNAVTIGKHGYREMTLLRKRELQGAFRQSGLIRRVDHLQLKGLLYTYLMRLGIRL